MRIFIPYIERHYVSMWRKPSLTGLYEIKFNENKKICETCPLLCLAESVLIYG